MSPAEHPVRVLMIEDNPGDTRLVHEALRDAGEGSIRLEGAGRLAEGLKLIRRGEVDAVLLDLSLPDSQGLATLAGVQAIAPMLPIVVLTGLDDEETAVTAVRDGAQDYLVKGRFDGSLLARSLRYGIARKRAEEALRASEERFRSLVKHALVGIFIVRDGRIAYLNPEQQRLFGAVPGDFELRTFRDVHDEDAEKFQMLCEAVDSVPPREIEMELRFFPFGKKSDGVGLRWVHCRTSPMESEGESLVLVNMMDITRTKEMEHSAMIQERMATLGHVSVGIAHDIRNPLSGLNIYVSALEKICEDQADLGAEAQERIRAVVARIRSASERIDSVIGRVMDFSKPAAPRLATADLTLAIEEAIEFSTVTLRKRGVFLDRSKIEALPECRADRHLVSQVLLNLITNAAHAMEKSEGPKRLAIAASSAAGRIVIRVGDSGPGVPVPLRARIFDPFYTTKVEGYGIGLYFSRRVIADHGGTLEVGTSELGGAEFRIDIPVVGPEKGS